MAAQYQFFGTQQAICKVWDTDAGGFPIDWEQPSFDDSAWPGSVVPFGAAAFLSTSEYPAEGIEGVSPWVTPPTEKSSFLFRFHFTAPDAPTWTHYQWDCQIPSGNFLPGPFYINGVAFSGRNVPTVQAPHYQYGADNVIAGAVTVPTVGPEATLSRWSGQAWVALRQIFYVPTIGSQAWAWGTVTPGVNDTGFLGVGDLDTHLTPTACVGLPLNVARIVSNGRTTWFLTSDGSIWACGDNNQGLVTAPPDASAYPTPVLFRSGVFNPYVDITLGEDFGLAVLSNGDVNIFGTAAWLIAAGHGPNIGTVLYPGRISAGKNFAWVIQDALGVASAGDNTYGQLGQGTTGGILSTWTTSVDNAHFPAYAISNVSAGDDQTLITFADGTVLGCGRAEYGSLGETNYTTYGVGPNKIISTPRLVTSFGVGGFARQAGPLAFIARLSSETERYIFAVWGDGVPFGGAADDNGTVVYGTGTGADGRVVFRTYQYLTFPFSDLFYASDLAVTSSGSQNPYAPGDSRAVFAAIGTFDEQIHDGFIVAEHPQLFTWGWGGAGQMGSGADATSNVSPISVNGLADVIGATVCAAGMFAVSAVAGVGTTVRRGRSFAQVVG